MSKRRSSHEHQSLVAKLPSEWPGAPSGPNEQQQAREWLTQVATIRDAIAPLILATGVHQGDDWVEAVAEFLNEDCLVIRDDIQRLDERLHQQGIDTEIHCADFRGPDSRDDQSTIYALAFFQFRNTAVQPRHGPGSENCARRCRA